MREPVSREANNASHSHALVADLSVRSVWIPQSEVLFDVRVIDTDAWTYCDRSPMDVLSAEESDKKKKYLQTCSDRKSLFTPLCVSVFVKRLA